LEGLAPFGADLTPPPPGALFNRMPDGFPPVPQDRINEIRAWIARGCPDQVVRAGSWFADNDGGVGVPSVHVAFWRDLDARSMFQASDQTRQDIDAFFGIADNWFAFARDGAQEPSWAQALADASVRAAVSRLEDLQRGVVTAHFGRPVLLLTLLDGFERFGNDTLPDDPLRPQDGRHRMNGKIMWFYWSAFCDACLRLSARMGTIPVEFWQGVGRGILLGLLNDGLFRRRFTVNGFTADDVGKQQARDYVRLLGQRRFLPN
jgi:hypothetical protein